MNKSVKDLQEELNKEYPDRSVVLRILTDARNENPIECLDYPTGKIISCWESYRAVRDEEIRPKRQTKTSAAKIVVIVTIFCILVGAAPSVFGAQSVFEILGEWTRERFSFLFSDSNTPGVHEEYLFVTDNSDLQQVYDTVTAAGVTQPVVPMWVPQAFTLKHIRTSSIRDGTYIEALLTDENTTITLSIKIREQSSHTSYYKEMLDGDILEIAGVKHYILQNDGEFVAVWVSKNLECCLSACDESDYFYKMLFSIYRGVT